MYTCAVVSLCYVQSLVCGMCSLQSVLRAVFSRCYVQFTVRRLVASLRACLASLAWRKRETDRAKERERERKRKRERERISA